MSKANKILTDIYASIEWKQTDPDNFQYGRKVREGVYEFREFDRNNYTFNLDDYPTKEAFIDAVWDNSEFWEEMTVVMAHYKDDEIENHISAYYDSLEQLKEIYGDDWEFIVAECIFEQESGLY